MKIRGNVKDRNETLVGASVYVSDFYGNIKEGVGTFTDIDGNYTLDIPSSLIEGSYITAKMAGYTSKSERIYPNHSLYNFVLSDSVQEYDDVKIIADSPRTACIKRGGTYNIASKKCDVKDKKLRNGIIIASALLLVLGGAFVVSKLSK